MKYAAMGAAVLSAVTGLAAIYSTFAAIWGDEPVRYAFTAIVLGILCLIAVFASLSYADEARKDERNKLQAQNHAMRSVIIAESSSHDRGCSCEFCELAA